MSRDGRLTTLDDRPALVFERRLAHTPERVWRAISDRDEFAAWFVAPIEVEQLETGATFEAMGQTGRITDFEDGCVLAWEWGGEDFRFEVRPDGEGTVLTFSHVFDERERGAHQAVGWDLHLSRLEALLDGRAVPTDAELMEGFEPEHEYYTEAFDIDLAVSRRRMQEMMKEA